MINDEIRIRTILDLATEVYPASPVTWLFGITVGLLRRHGLNRQQIIKLVDAAINELARLTSKELPS